MEPRVEIGRREFGGERADPLGIAREARVGRQPVVFEGDPVGADIAEIGGDDGDAAGPRLLGGHDVIGPAVAVQHQVGDLVLVEHVGDKAAPLAELAAVMGRRPAPQQLVAKMQVDAVDAVAARDQRRAEPVEKPRHRPLQKEERALPVANGEDWAEIVHRTGVTRDQRPSAARGRASAGARCRGFRGGRPSASRGAAF